MSFTNFWRYLTFLILETVYFRWVCRCITQSRSECPAEYLSPRAVSNNRLESALKCGSKMPKRFTTR